MPEASLVNILLKAVYTLVLDAGAYDFRGL